MADINVTTEVTIITICEGCGSDLDSAPHGRGGEGWHDVKVEPCEDCLEKARQEGHAEGYEDGYDQCRKEMEEAEETP